MHPMDADYDYTGAIVGGVVGGIAALALLTLVAGLALWSWRTFSFRAHKRLIEDQVYTIVIGAQSSDVFGWTQAAGKEDQVRISIFYHEATCWQPPYSTLDCFSVVILHSCHSEVYVRFWVI